MKLSLIVVPVAATALVAGVAGCGNKTSSSTSTSSTSSSSSAAAASSSTASQPADYTKLLIKASDIEVPGDTFTMRQPEINPNGKPGVAAAFVNQTGTRRIDDTILVLPSATTASGALDATKSASEAAVSGATTQPVDVGSGGVTISGTSPDGSKAVTILLFTEGTTLTTVEFGSAADDPVPPEILIGVGQKQDAAIKARLPG